MTSIFEGHHLFPPPPTHTKKNTAFSNQDKGHLEPGINIYIFTMYDMSVAFVDSPSFYWIIQWLGCSTYGN